jgi:hypothetical protein
MVAVVLAGAAAIWLSARRELTICALRLQEGRVDVERGALPAGVLSDLRDVARMDPGARLRVRVLRERGRARVEIAGNGATATQQRVRNVVGNVSLARLLAAAARRA